MTDTQPNLHNSNPENRRERQALLATSIDLLSRGPQTTLSAHSLGLARQELRSLQAGYDGSLPQFSLRLDMIKMLHDPRIIRDLLGNARDRFDAFQKGLLQDILSDMAQFQDNRQGTLEIQQEVLDLLGTTDPKTADIS
jgi:hypothetical protein